MKVQGPKSTKNEEEELKARLKQFGSNISFSSVKEYNPKSKQTNRKVSKKNADVVSWTKHHLLPKGWLVAPLHEAEEDKDDKADASKINKGEENKEDDGKIQVREPGGKILRSHGEAAAFMEEDGSYGEEDIQNLYNVSLPGKVEGARTKEGTSESARTTGVQEGASEPVSGLNDVGASRSAGVSTGRAGHFRSSNCC